MRGIVVLWLGWLLVLSSAANAEPVERFALVVGSNQGTLTDQPLRYAEADAASLGAVLRYLGGFERTGLTELYTPTGDALIAAVQRVALQAKAAHDAGANVLVVFYFSGHSDGDALRTHGDLVPFSYVRRAFKASGAPVRVLIVDACRAGGLTRRKGASPVPPIELRALGDLATEGEAFIASTTSDELARESALLRGSFFTHHFVSGLRGAADRSGDGKVTLGEAYDYAYSRTVLEAVGEQHPTYTFDLKGRGEVVLTSLQAASAALEFEPGPERTYIIADQRSGQVVAEVKVTPSAGVRVALAPGRYYLRYGDAADPHVRSIELAPGTVVEVEPEALRQPIVALPAKGDASAMPRVLVEGEEPHAAAPMPKTPRAVRGAQLLAAIGLGFAPVYISGGTPTEVAFQSKISATGSPSFERTTVASPGGLSLEPIHLRIDVGVRILGRVDLVASLRVQPYVWADAHTRTTVDGSPPVGGTSAASSAVAGLLRARVRILRGPFTPFVEIAAGGGEIRPTIDVRSAGTGSSPLVDQATATAFQSNSNVNRQLVCPSSGSCRDSVLLGYGLAGVGIGGELEVVRRGHTGLALTISTVLLGAFGVNNGLVCDIDLGFLARFL